jgi:hypothetical protein
MYMHVKVLPVFTFATSRFLVLFLSTSILDVFNLKKKSHRKIMERAGLSKKKKSLKLSEIKNVK